MTKGKPRFLGKGNRGFLSTLSLKGDAHAYTTTHIRKGPVATPKTCRRAESAPLARTPPPCNTGGKNHPTPQNTHESQDFIFPRFDWYSATIQKEVEPVRVLRWAQLFGDPTPMKAFHGYDECMDFGQLKILYGGMNGPHGVHVIIHGGDACQAIVEAFRRLSRSTTQPA